MDIKNQVVSLELAKQLRKLGIKQDSYFWYTLPEGKYVQKFMELNPAYEDDEDAPTKVQLTAQPDFYGIYGEPVTKVSAFTVAELYNLLYMHGIGDILLDGVKPEHLADYLGEKLCKAL